LSFRIREGPYLAAPLDDAVIHPASANRTGTSVWVESARRDVGYRLGYARAPFVAVTPDVIDDHKDVVPPT
jgi:hypothetical protein